MKQKVLYLCILRGLYPADYQTLQLPRCEKRYKESCVDRYDHIDCLSAQEFCFESLWGFFKGAYAGRSPLRSLD